MCIVVMASLLAWLFLFEASSPGDDNREARRELDAHEAARVVAAADVNSDGSADAGELEAALLRDRCERSTLRIADLLLFCAAAAPGHPG